MGIVLIKDRMSVKYLGTLKFIEEYLKLNKTIASQHEITTALYAAGHKGNFGVMFRILREHDILLTNNLIYSWNEEKNCNIHMAREVVKSLRKYVAERKAIAKAKNKENVVELSIAAPRNIKKRKKRKEDSEEKEKEEPITVLGLGNTWVLGRRYTCTPNILDCNIHLLRNSNVLYWVNSNPQSKALRYSF